MKGTFCLTLLSEGSFNKPIKQAQLVLRRKKSTVRKTSESDILREQGDTDVDSLIGKVKLNNASLSNFLITYGNRRLEVPRKIIIFTALYSASPRIPSITSAQNREIVTCELQGFQVSNSFSFFLKLNLSVKKFNCDQMNKVSTTFAIGYKGHPEQEISESEIKYSSRFQIRMPWQHGSRNI